MGSTLIALGTYLIYLGSKKDTDKGQDQINKSQNKINLKLDSFKKMLENAKTSNLTPIEKQKQIDTIQIQFDNWAKNLNENSNEIELNQEKQLVARKEKKIVIQRQWNLFLNKTFEDILKMAKSINKEASTNNIKVHAINQKIPNDFFDDKNQYSLELEFKSNIVLTIYVEVSPPNYPSLLYRPNIKIHLVLFKSLLAKESRNTITLSFFDQIGHFSIDKYGSFKDFMITNEKEYYSASELNKILQEIISYQFVLANKKT